jgi:succinyl-CoA synthetase alpha subunit
MSMNIICSGGVNNNKWGTTVAGNHLQAATRPVPLLDLLVLGRKETTEGTALMAMISVPPSLALDLVSLSIDAHAWKFTSGSLQFNRLN